MGLFDRFGKKTDTPPTQDLAETAQAEKTGDCFPDFVVA